MIKKCSNSLPGVRALEQYGGSPQQVIGAHRMTLNEIGEYIGLDRVRFPTSGKLYCMWVMCLEGTHNVVKR